MTATAKNNQLLFRFRDADTLNGVSRATTEKLTAELGFTGETQLIHFALSKLAREVLPAYEADEGALTASQLKAIRAQSPQGVCKAIKSSLF